MQRSPLEFLAAFAVSVGIGWVANTVWTSSVKKRAEELAKELAQGAKNG